MMFLMCYKFEFFDQQLMSYLYSSCSSFCWGDTLQESPRLRCFKSDWHEIWGFWPIDINFHHPDPKRYFLGWKRAFWALTCQNWFHTMTGTASKEKNTADHRDAPILHGWRLPRRILESLNLSLNEAVDVAQNRPLWRMMSTFATTHS